MLYQIMIGLSSTMLIALKVLVNTWGTIIDLPLIIFYLFYGIACSVVAFMQKISKLSNTSILRDKLPQKELDNNLDNIVYFIFLLHWSELAKLPHTHLK